MMGGIAVLRGSTRAGLVPDPELPRLCGVLKRLFCASGLRDLHYHPRLLRLRSQLTAVAHRIAWEASSAHNERGIFDLNVRWNLHGTR